MTRFYSNFIFLLIVAFYCNYSINAQYINIKENSDLLDKQVKEFYITADNIHLILLKISNELNVPIGFEKSFKDDLLEDSTIIIEIKNGTLKDVLDAVIKQKNIYEWKLKDNVINVSPIIGYRDSVIQQILETTVEKFSITKGTSRYNVRSDLGILPQISEILVDNDITFKNQAFGSRDISVLGKNFSLELENISFESILNKIIKESETKYWIINRFGENKNFLLINF